MESDDRIRQEARVRFAEALDWLRGQQASYDSAQARQAIAFAQDQLITRLVVEAAPHGTEEIDRQSAESTTGVHSYVDRYFVLDSSFS